MIPFAVMHYAVQAPRRFGTVEKPDQREHAVGNTGEGSTVEQLEAGEEKGRNFALAAALRAS
jgi:hypothetical protein